VGKNVAVFVDVANIFYAAKAAGVDIDYVTLLKAASAGRDLVRAYAYTGLDPDNENQRNFHDFLRRSNYKVVSKDIRKYGDGKVKANLDIELVVDMMKTARNLDIAIVVSGDGDFAPAIRAVQEQGVRVEVISFRGNTSSDLIEVADQFTDPLIAQAITCGVNVAGALKTEITSLEKTILAQARQRPEYALLESIPGIGQTLAMTILCETGSLSRFPDAAHFCSYCRCVPSKHLSNGKVKGKGNTRNGNPYLSWAFIETAHFAIRFEPLAKKYYERKKARTNPLVALRAVAHKMARACFYVMRDQVPFQAMQAFG